MWQEIDNSLYKKFEFKDFNEAVSFINQVARIADELNHHPKITNIYNVVELWFTSHDAGNTVTGKDQAATKLVDELFSKPN